MPIYIHLANLIIDKNAIKNNYKGGIEEFKNKYSINGENLNQEDNELFSLAEMNIEDFDIDELINNGLHYDEVLNFSKDFVLKARYSNYQWEVNWLQDNNVFAWHIHCEKKLIEKAIQIGNLTMDEIIIMFDKGNQNVFDTIKL
jgi:hypothetical protein